MINEMYILYQQQYEIPRLCICDLGVGCKGGKMSGK